MMIMKICKPDCNCGCHSSGYPQEVIETCERCYLEIGKEWKE